MSDNASAIQARFAEQFCHVPQPWGAPLGLSLLDAFLLSRRVENCRPKTLEHYAYVVGSLLRAVPDPDHEACYGYLDALRARLSPAGYASHVRSLVVFCNWLSREGGPTIRLRIPKVDHLPAIYSDEDIERLLRVIPRRTIWGTRDFLIVHLLLDTGMRAGECCRLRLCDTDLASRMVRVLGKGGKERVIAISQTTARLLAAWLRRRGRGLPTDYLFPSRKGTQLRPNSLRQRIARWCAKAGVKIPRTLHAFRHTFAVMAFERGADIADLKDDLGHSRYETVDVYRRASGKVRRERHDRYSPVDYLSSSRGARFFQSSGTGTR